MLMAISQSQKSSLGDLFEVLEVSLAMMSERCQMLERCQIF